MADSCQHGNESWRCVKSRTFLDQLGSTMDLVVCKKFVDNCFVCLTNNGYEYTGMSRLRSMRKTSASNIFLVCGFTVPVSLGVVWKT